MAAPSTPTNFNVQAANGRVLCSWDISAGATSYVVLRSTDGVTFASVGTPTAITYLDTTITVNTRYYYAVQASNGSASVATPSQQIVATLTGIECLSSIRLQAQQRADRVGSNFVNMPEWNKNINQSATELYDLLVTAYEDYYLASPFAITTTGVSSYALPNDFYKLLGVDYSVGSSTVSLGKYNFSERNRYSYASTSNAFAGYTDMRYRVMGANIRIEPLPSSGQTITLHYIPRLAPMLADTDTLDGVSGWIEYVIIDAAIKALQKEESDVSVLMAEKAALKERIENVAQNRDAGLPNTISRVRSQGPSGFGNDGWDS